MPLPTIKEGDTVYIQGTEFECTGFAPPYYWFKEAGTVSYYYMICRSQQDLEKDFAKGNLVIGKKENVAGGNSLHFHDWKRYNGIRRVYDYCTCGAEKDLTWREIGDDKKRKT